METKNLRKIVAFCGLRNARDAEITELSLASKVGQGAELSLDWYWRRQLHDQCVVVSGGVGGLRANIEWNLKINVREEDSIIIGGLSLYHETNKEAWIKWSNSQAISVSPSPCLSCHWPNSYLSSP